jgi:glycerophosphoryl diester phosphodiesterase
MMTTSGTHWLSRSAVLVLGGLLLRVAPLAAAVSAGPENPGTGAGPARRGPLVIGHAGSGFLHPFFNPLPPSSLRSLTRALRQGADGVEVDIRLSQDSIPVLYHDHTLDSMTEGTGCVSQTTAARLTRLRYRGGWPYDWFQHEKLLTFETLLRTLAQRPDFPYLHLDLHEDDACTSNDAARSQALARRLRDLLVQYRVPSGRLLILTNRASTLVYLRQLLPAVPLGLEMGADFAAGLATLRRLPAVQMAVLHKNDLTPERAAQVHALGKEVVVFGGRSAKAVSRVLAAGTDAYEVDNVRRLRAALRRQYE